MTTVINSEINAAEAAYKPYWDAACDADGAVGYTDWPAKREKADALWPAAHSAAQACLDALFERRDRLTAEEKTWLRKHAERRLRTELRYGLNLTIRDIIPSFVDYL